MANVKHQHIQKDRVVKLVYLKLIWSHRDEDKRGEMDLAVVMQTRKKNENPIAADKSGIVRLLMALFLYFSYHIHHESWLRRYHHNFSNHRCQFYLPDFWYKIHVIIECMEYFILKRTNTIAHTLTDKPFSKHAQIQHNTPDVFSISVGFPLFLWCFVLWWLLLYKAIVIKRFAAFI